jgi:hypothetical protein
VGILSEGKQGFWFAFNHWGAYGYAAKESGIAKENDLYSYFRRGQTVKVTGTLRYFPWRGFNAGRQAKRARAFLLRCRRAKDVSLVQPVAKASERTK